MAYAIMLKRGRSPRAPGPGVEVFVENLPGNVYRRVRRPAGGYHFDYLSSGLFRQFGIDHERLLAERTVRFDWVHPDDRARMIADLEISAATLGLLDHRVRIIGQDGRVHWARGIARPSRRPDGATVWDGIVIDVTREVEAEAALRLAKDEADRAHGGVATLVAEVTRRLAEPVRELGWLLEAYGRGQPGSDALGALRACHARLAAALDDAGGAQADPTKRLTLRQEEVRRLLAAGLSNKAIAQKLGITPGTAKLHVAAILRVVGVRSRRQLRLAA